MGTLRVEIVNIEWLNVILITLTTTAAKR